MLLRGASSPTLLMHLAKRITKAIRQTFSPKYEKYHMDVEQGNNRKFICIYSAFHYTYRLYKIPSTHSNEQIMK